MAIVSVGPLSILSVAVINDAWGGHKPGNFEIKTSGFTVAANQLDSAVTDRVYVTTLQAANSLNTMIALLTLAVTSNRMVRITLTDDPQRRAFSGRCSLLAVELT